MARGLTLVLALIGDACPAERPSPRDGHLVGNAVLRMVAQTFAACVRPFDFVGRWGGDEMMGIIARVERWQLLAITERLRSMVAQAVIADGDEPIRTTISIGAALARPGEEPQELLARADRLLYHSKARGPRPEPGDPGRPGAALMTEDALFRGQ